MGSRNRFNTSGNKKSRQSAPSAGTQNANPFGKNFAPFEMPDDAPIRGIIGQRTKAERNAAPQNANPFAPNFQPFYLPDHAPVRGVIGPRPTSSPTQKPIQPRIERKPGPWDEGYVKPNTTMEPTEKATLSEYLNPGARQETRDIPGGGTQDGLKMSGGVSAAFVPEYANSSFNQLLAGVMGSEGVPYSSNQLPGTASNPFSGTAPKTQSFDTGVESVTGNSLANFGGDGSAAFAQSRETTGNDTFNPNATRIEGGSSRKKGGSLAEALADKEGINSYMSKFSSGDQERAANRAFLDTEGSMAGLRAKEAVNGVVYAGGQHYMSGKSGDDQAIAINRGQARDISNGKSNAQSLLKAHIDKNKNAETPVEAQEPLTIEKPGVKQSFGRTTPITPGIDTSIPDTTAFNSNNGVDVPEFGNTGGYKSTSKKPEVDYSSIFSY